MRESANEVGKTVAALYREYEASVLAGDVERWVAQWVEDGVQLPPDFPMNVGRDQIREWMEGMFESFRFLEFDIAEEDVEASGDVASAYGTYTWLAEPRAGGDQISYDGKFLTLFRKQPDGSWKIYRDVFNSNVP